MSESGRKSGKNRKTRPKIVAIAAATPPTALTVVESSLSHVRRVRRSAGSDPFEAGAEGGETRAGDGASSASVALAGGRSDGSGSRADFQHPGVGAAAAEPVADGDRQP